MLLKIHGLKNIPRERLYLGFGIELCVTLPSIGVSKNQFHDAIADSNDRVSDACSSYHTQIKPFLEELGRRMGIEILVALTP